MAIGKCPRCGLSLRAWPAAAVLSVSSVHRCTAMPHPGMLHLDDDMQASSAAELQLPHLPEASMPKASGVQQPNTSTACTMTACRSASRVQQNKALPSRAANVLPPPRQQGTLEQCEASSAKQGALTAQHCGLGGRAADSPGPDHAPACQLACEASVQCAGSGSECVVCWEADADIVLQPCGHACACSGCAHLFLNGTALCPICRSIIKSGIALDGRVC